jgi:hypothetical protein
MDKHSSLLRTFVNYSRKKFYNIGPWNQRNKTFYGRNFLMFLFVPGRPFQPSLTFVSDFRAYPSEAPFSCTLE